MKKREDFLWKITIPAAVLATVVFFCRNEAEPDENILAIIPAYASAEFDRIRESAGQYAENNGYELLQFLPSEMTVQAQRTAINEALSEGASCILIETVAEGGFQDVLDQCSEQEVPVIVYNSRINSSDVYTEVVPYPAEAVSRAMLSLMTERKDASGQFAILSSTSQDYLREARTREIMTLLEDGTFPSLHLTGIGFVKEEQELITEKIAHLLEKYPDLEGFLCYSTIEANSVADFIVSEKSDLKLICEASSEDLVSSLPDSTVVLTYNYAKYGHLLADLAISAISADSRPAQGDTFTDSSGSTYTFTPKWEYNAQDDADSFASLAMQAAPDVITYNSNP